MTITPGRARGLDTLANDQGVFCVLAIDHRDSLRAVVPGVGDAELTQLKLDLIAGVGPRASGVMLEPELSLPQAITSGALSGSTGFMAALEAQGYMQDPWGGPTQMLDGWSAAQAKAMGASAAKLLLAYDPDRPDHAASQRAVVASVVHTCHALDLAVLVEPVAFGMANSDRARKVRQTVEQLTGLGIDVLKLEFPGDPDDVAGWADACVAVNAAATVPWVVLSSGVTFDQYRAQLEVAFAHGCSGFTGGRAIWRPISEVEAEDRPATIAGIVIDRFDTLCELANEHATPWRVALG